jgi:hypothetical protein
MYSFDVLVNADMYTLVVFRARGLILINFSSEG